MSNTNLFGWAKANTHEQSLAQQLRHLGDVGRNPPRSMYFPRLKRARNRPTKRFYTRLTEIRQMTLHTGFNTSRPRPYVRAISLNVSGTVFASCGCRKYECLALLGKICESPLNAEFNLATAGYDAGAQLFDVSCADFCNGWP